MSMEQTPQGPRPERRPGRRSFLINAGGLCLSAALAGCAAPKPPRRTPQSAKPGPAMPPLANG
ncbi:MAG: LD-carboxypeptidase, partial [Achromobacter sp.]